MLEFIKIKASKHANSLPRVTQKFIKTNIFPLYFIGVISAIIAFGLNQKNKISYCNKKKYKLSKAKKIQKQLHIKICILQAFMVNLLK